MRALNSQGDPLELHPESLTAPHGNKTWPLRLEIIDRYMHQQGFHTN